MSIMISGGGGSGGGGGAGNVVVDESNILTSPSASDFFAANLLGTEFDWTAQQNFNDGVTISGAWSATGIYSNGSSLYLSGDLYDQSGNSFESLFNSTGGSVAFSERAQQDASGNDIQGSYALQGGNYGSMIVGFASDAGSASFASNAGNADNDGSGNNIVSTYLPFSGGNMSGNLNMGGATILTNSVYPVSGSASIFVDVRQLVANDGATVIEWATPYRLDFPPVATGSAPAYKKGAWYFDDTIGKFKIGGATAWEIVTSM